MMSWEDHAPDLIVLDVRLEVDGVTLGTSSIIPFSLILDRPPFQLIPIHDSFFGYCAFVPFVLMPEDTDEIVDQDVYMVTCSGRVT